MARQNHSKEPQQYRRAFSTSQPVLVVVDDSRILTLVSRLLLERNFQVIATKDAGHALDACIEDDPVVVLIDIDNPVFVDLVPQIRELSQCCILLLTSDASHAQVVRALDSGADGVVIKPFNKDVLCAYIRALLRRSERPTNGEGRPQSYVYEDLKADFANRVVTLAGNRVRLSALQYRLLEFLASNAGRVLTYEQILTSVWGPDYYGSTGVLRAQVRNLRKLLSNEERARFIRTERQVGYHMPDPRSESEGLWPGGNAAG